MNVDRMLRSITWKQLTEWMAFAELEPFDETRQDIRIAELQATLANIHRNPETRPTPWRWTDFKLPFGDEPPPEPYRTPTKSCAELKFIAAMWVANADAEAAEVKPRTRRKR